MYLQCFEEFACLRENIADKFGYPNVPNFSQFHLLDITQTIGGIWAILHPLWILYTPSELITPPLNCILNLIAVIWGCCLFARRERWQICSLQWNNLIATKMDPTQRNNASCYNSENLDIVSYIVLYPSRTLYYSRPGWQNLAAFRREQRWQWKFPSSEYLHCALEENLISAHSAVT